MFKPVNPSDKPSRSQSVYQRARAIRPDDPECARMIVRTLFKFCMNWEATICELVGKKPEQRKYFSRNGDAVDLIEGLIRKCRESVVFQQVMAEEHVAKGTDPEAGKRFRSIMWQWLTGTDSLHPGDKDMRIKAAAILADDYITDKRDVTVQPPMRITGYDEGMERMLGGTEPAEEPEDEDKKPN